MLQYICRLRSSPNNQGHIRYVVTSCMPSCFSINGLPQGELSTSAFRSLMGRGKLFRRYGKTRAFCGAILRDQITYTKQKKHHKGACHKAGFTCRNLVGRWLAAAENKRYMQRKRREINPRPTTKGVRTICSYSFSHALPCKVSCVTPYK